MSLVSNIASLSAQRRLGNATESVSASSERLSSGMRINRASDDAAGLAIADSLRVDTRLYTTATRNIGDGVSTLNIVDGALQNQTSILIRLSELAEQSANGTFSNIQRATTNREYQALLREFGRIGDTTTFNNLYLLQGGRGTNLSTLALQAGITGSNTSQIQLALSDSGSISGTLMGTNIGVTIDPTGSFYSIDDLVEAMPNGLLRQTVRDSSGTNHDILLAFQADAGIITLDAFMRAEESDGAVSTKSGDWVSYGNQGFVNYDVSTGRITGTGTTTIQISNIAGGATASISLDLRGLTVTNSASKSNVNVVEFTGIESQVQARNAFAILEQRRSDIANLLGQVGATQSRLKTALNVIQAQRENSASAESRIRDVDVASETASLVASQIRQKLATQVLGLANNQPKMLIDLIRG